jgi:hypothetical protein
MPEHDGPPTRPRGYETRDANALAIWCIGAGLVVTVAVSQLALWGLLDYFKRHEPGPNEAANPMAARQGLAPLNERLGEIPSPRLEGLQELQAALPGVRSSLPTPEGNSPLLHPDNLSAAQQLALNGYAAVDKDKGIVRIPIDRAISAALHNGLLKSAPGAPELPPAGGATRPSGSNSGRGVRPEPKR